MYGERGLFDHLFFVCLFLKNDDYIVSGTFLTWPLFFFFFFFLVFVFFVSKL